MNVNAGKVVVEDILVVDGAVAHVDADWLPAEPVEDLASVLQGLPGDFQQQTLLGIHALGLSRRETEEEGVEPVDVVEEAAPPRVERAGNAHPGIVEGQEATSVRGNLADGVGSVTQQAPEREGTGGAGESTTDADDRDVDCLSNRHAMLLEGWLSIGGAIPPQSLRGVKDKSHSSRLFGGARVGEDARNSRSRLFVKNP